MKFDWKRDIKTFIVISFASALMAVNINTFVQAGGLYPGGVAGLTILLQRMAESFLGLHLSFAVINFLLNTIPVFIGFRFIGKKFTLYSCLSILITGVLTDILPTYVVTYDTLLISIFGGILTGLSISMCLLMDTTTGGTDFIAIYLSRKKGIDSWNIILYFNIVILSVAGLIFGWDKALYSIIFQYTCTQVVHVLYKRYQKITLFIITSKPQEVCELIFATCNHGATILEGKGSFEHCTRNIVYSVISADESKMVMYAIKKIDPESFINSIKTELLDGRFYQKPTD